MASFSDLLSRWPDLGVLARDIGRPYDTVAAWKRRGNVPVAYWADIARSAANNRIDGVTEAALREASRSVVRAARRSPTVAAEPSHDR